ncbi:hypothetical protein [Rhodopseudomonas palustris]|uniref:hypothetical protein n=1 Tax=Rhodopseudomonas palustris TaxID=1076 RepID=UPI0012EDE784
MSGPFGADGERQVSTAAPTWFRIGACRVAATTQQQWKIYANFESNAELLDLPTI